ncbi:nuclear transport factor 2 family protein [Streptomyces sp. SLBN-8D4]|jgi:hypothetical protein|uniref:nuclear transport factor 2 family protein n=1 Tax=Streptomyces sp. SLBN-8D4 TaxID=3377728 RepID=UPI003C7E9ADF
MRAFREAVEAGDLGAVEALLADNVVFTSPVVFKPYEGKAITAAILSAVVKVFEDFRYVSELSSEDGRDHALVFATRVGERALDGCDFIHVDENGLIDRFMVMVRPLSGAQALATAMGARFEEIAKEAALR